MSYWIKREHVPKDAVCRVCGEYLRNLDNIGEYRNLWPGPRTDFMCSGCFMKRPEDHRRPHAT